MKQLFFAGLLSGLVFAAGLHAQHITSVSVMPGVIIPVHTARNHLTVLDLDSKIEDLAAENTAFDVQWRGHTVFVLPKDTDQSTNLFVWTKSGRVVYELLPPAATIQTMDVSVDTHFPNRASADSASAKPAAAADVIPSDLLVRARMVEFDKKTRRQSSLLISDVYRDHDKLFLRYEVRNNGSVPLQVDQRPVVSAATIPHVSSLNPIQLSPDKAAGISTGAPLPMIADETSASSIAPGQSSRGVVGVHIPPASRPLAVRLWVPSKTSSLQALVVVP